MAISTTERVVTARVSDHARSRPCGWRGGGSGTRQPQRLDEGRSFARRRLGTGETLRSPHELEQARRGWTVSGGGGTGEWAFDVPPGGFVVGDPAGSAGAGELPCARLQFDARLRSVDPVELAEVEVGDVLVVAFREEPRLVVGAYRAGGNPMTATPVGVLLDRLSELVPCLTLRDYEAEVTSISGGHVRVMVGPVGR